MNILYYGACWPTNIGNAFIDYGSIYTIKTALPDANVYFASELPRYLFNINNLNMDNSLDLADLMDIDYLVVSGMTLCNDFITVEGPILKKLSKRGVKIIFSGCGGARYNDDEITNFKDFFKTINLIGFISRDTVSYNNFQDCCPLTYSGMDCAFFLKEAYKPAPLNLKDFVVYNFDEMDEPVIEKHDKPIIRTDHACTEFIHKSSDYHLGLFKKKKSARGNILMSDIPEDYLNLYANTYGVYSNRVHACIATLAFGNRAKHFSKSPRAYLFDRLGVKNIREELVQLNPDMLRQEKENQLSFLKKIFENA